MPIMRFLQSLRAPVKQSPATPAAATSVPQNGSYSSGTPHKAPAVEKIQENRLVYKGVARRQTLQSRVHAQGSHLSLPQPRPNGWSSDVEKSSLTAAPQADPLQSALVKVLYKPLDDMAEGLEEPKNMAVTFKKDIRFASKIGAYHFWPFAPVPDNEDSTIIFQHDVPHLLRKAYHAERLPQFLPLLHSLFAKLPPCSVPHSPHLLDTLHTLADLKCDSKTPDSCKQQLEVMLAVWQQPLQQAVAPKPVAVSTTSALNSSAVSGNVQQQHGFGSPESAVQSTADTAIPEEKICSVGEAHPAAIPWTMSPEYVAIARKDDFSPTAVEAYQMVASPSPPPPVAQPSDKVLLSQRQLLSKMGHGPHGKHAIKAYIKGHINTFLFDFNERLRQRRKAQSQDAEQNQAVPSTDTTEDVSAVLSPGLAVGCDGTNSHCASEAIQPDEDYPYLG